MLKESCGLSAPTWILCEQDCSSLIGLAWDSDSANLIIFVGFRAPPIPSRFRHSSVDWKVFGKVWLILTWFTFMLLTERESSVLHALIRANHIDL
jgi:hypothetical protein